MIPFLRHLIGWIFVVFRSREDLILENLALRQQLLALQTKRPRHRLSTAHKLFWIALRKLWSGWKEPLILVTPRTVVAWHRAGFRLYWKWLSQAQKSGRQKAGAPGGILGRHAEDQGPDLLAHPEDGFVSWLHPCSFPMLYNVISVRKAFATLPFHK